MIDVAAGYEGITDEDLEQIQTHDSLLTRVFETAYVIAYIEMRQAFTTRILASQWSTIRERLHQAGAQFAAVRLPRNRYTVAFWQVQVWWT